MACKEEEKEVLQRSKSIEDCCSSKASSKKHQDDDTKTQKSGFDQTLSELLLTFHNLPLIPNETALNLLKIQSKFETSHPCLCTSRFRHTLHQLDEEHHQGLDRLCLQLSQILKLEEDCDPEQPDLLYNNVIPCVFGDINGLKEKSKEWQIRSGGKNDKEKIGLSKKLNDIICRLVTDYRAIFAIEVEFSRSFEKSDDELQHSSSSSMHEHHRKRHEEVDNCPEEIKLMKVEALTLECTASSSSPDQSPMLHNVDSGPKFCLKSLTSNGTPEKDHSIHRHSIEQHNSALEDVRSRHHHRRVHQPTTPRDTTNEKTSTSKINEILDFSTDSTPVSSDVEHSQNPSPRRACQRKRKERRDSIGDGQDKKFSKSSSDVFPTGSEVDSKEKAALQTLKKVQTISDFSKTNLTEQDCKKCQNANSSNDSSKCVYYVSDDEINEVTTCKRAIMRPRRSRKYRHDSFKENEQEQESEDNEPKSPILPWKKSDVAAPPSPLSMCTPPPPVSSSSVLNLVTSLKSSIVNNNSLEDDQDSKDSSSSSSSASDETISTLDPAEEESKTFSVVHRNSYALPVQDSQNHPGYQPISWEPYGVNKTDIEESESEFSTRHFGLINSRQHLDKSHYGSNVNDHEVKSKIKQLSKQLSVVRKKIEDFEIKFEDGHGYKPSQAEKQNNKAIRKLLIQQNRIKRQIRLCRESGDSGVNVDDYSPVTSPSRPWSPSTDFSILTVYSDNSNDSDRNLDRLKVAVQKIEEKLSKERLQNGRPKALEEMTHEQVIQENSSLQSALTQYEIVLNHETTDDEKSVLKDLLARYRTVKKLMRRSSNVFNKDLELETIPEGSEIQLTLASPQRRINIEMNEKKNEDFLSEDDQPNLHAMSKMELLNVQRSAKEDKKQFRRWLKEKEAKFLEENGRVMPKDDLKDTDYYSKYKMTKAKLKLVDALLSKFVK